MKQEDIRILNLLCLSINQSLWGEVIPSLRKVRLEWNPQASCAHVIFYHDGPITAEVEDHYSYIYAEMETSAKLPKIEYEIIRCDYPDPLPKKEYTIYKGKEPFIDP